MMPEGPYISPWCSQPHFIASDVRCGDYCYTVVPDGVQRHNGLHFPSLREARQWLRDNGFKSQVKGVVNE
jgi:hypothetical protein